MHGTHLRGNTRAGPSRRSATRFARASSTPRSRRRGGRGSPRTCATTTRPRAARASRRGRRGTIEGRSLLGFRSGRPRGLSPPRAGARSRPRRGRRGFAPRARPRTRRKAWRDARVGGGGGMGWGRRTENSSNPPKGHRRKGTRKSHCDAIARERVGRAMRRVATRRDAPTAAGARYAHRGEEVLLERRRVHRGRPRGVFHDLAQKHALALHRVERHDADDGVLAEHHRRGARGLEPGRRGCEPHAGGREGDDSTLRRARASSSDRGCR